MPSPPRHRSRRTVSGYLRDSQLRRQLEEKVKETTRTRQAAEDGLKAAQDLIDQARRIDANVVEAEKVLADASAAMASKDYKVAADKANEALERGRRIYRDRARARSAMENNDFPSALDFTKEGLDTIKDDLTGVVNKEIRDAEDLMRTAQELGADTTRALTLIERARGDLGNLDFEKAANALK